MEANRYDNPELGFFDATLVSGDTHTPFEYVPEDEDEAGLIDACLAATGLFIKDTPEGEIRIEGP